MCNNQFISEELSQAKITVFLGKRWDVIFSLEVPANTPPST